MKSIRMLGLACGVALTAAAVTSAQQPSGGIKPAIDGQPEAKKTVPAGGVRPAVEAKPGNNKVRPTQAQSDAASYRFASGDETLTNGDRVTIRRKNGSSVTGTFVWSDPKANRLYVRPAPGQVPVAIPANDVDRVDRIATAVGTTGKDGVRPAFEEKVRPAGGPSYEIYSMTVHDGPFRRTFLFDTSLSPAEKDQLGALEKAGNDVTQKRTEVEMLQKAIEDAATQPPVTVVNSGAPGYAAPYYPVVPYPFYYPVAYGLYSPLLPGLNFGGNNIYYYGGIPTTFYPTYPAGGANTTVVLQGGGDNAKSLAALNKSLGEARAALAQAQKNYAALSHRAVYDDNGRIVAVRLEE